ncbi:MAG: tryptophan synthase subunit alpha, partial [Gammaproteobacteria bacterium]|nr:tryptophan synthase subunit alpha [Gammaproteobacteria bacterium]
TGTHVAADAPLEKVVAKLKQENAPPLVQGFGISKPEHIRQAVETGLDGAICGSAIVNLIAESRKNGDSFEESMTQLRDFIHELRSVTAK